MSSTVGTQTCNLAFNGIVYGGTNNGYNNGVGAATYDFAMTNNDASPFITVDLGLSTAVRMIKIHNRKDCCQFRLDNFDFYVGDSSDYHQNTHCPVSLMPTTFRQYPTGWAESFSCPLTGRYASMHILNSDNNLNVAEIMVFAANACPIRTATGATAVGGSVCSGAGWGQVCMHECNPGWIPVSGDVSSTCNGEVWDKPALVCRPPCLDLAPPVAQQDQLQIGTRLQPLADLQPRGPGLAVDEDGVGHDCSDQRKRRSRFPRSAFVIPLAVAS
jgi:hypothetical protein